MATEAKERLTMATERYRDAVRAGDIDAMGRLLVEQDKAHQAWLAEVQKSELKADLHRYVDLYSQQDSATGKRLVLSMVDLAVERAMR
jgi:hypothetical protein